MRKRLLYFALKYQGNFQKIYEAIKKKEDVDSIALQKIEQMIHSRYLTILDDQYPLKLKCIPQPPFVLFYYGNIALLEHLPCVAVIGTRNPTEYGKRMAIRIVTGLKRHQSVLISGMARGIDGIAQQCALQEKIPTIAVLGSGIDYCYPSCNQKLYQNIRRDGLVISEYPNALPPSPDHFLIRNRMIAALSEYIVVVEARKKSGTMNTVMHGLEYGKEIFCVPQLATVDSGCNDLIKQGAHLLENAADLFEEEMKKSENEAE